MSDSADVRGLPPIPRDVTLHQAREIVSAFGYELVMRPKSSAPVPPGFAPSPTSEG